MYIGSCPLTPKRIILCGTQMTPALAVGAKIGPTLSWALASNSGCSGAPRRRSCGLALKVSVDFNVPDERHDAEAEAELLDRLVRRSRRRAPRRGSR